MLKIALIGRPNVGKSTLFNRLVGKKLAIVDDMPGVTRDWREAKGKVGDISFTVLDTAGLEEDAKFSLTERMWQQTEQAINAADVLCFIIDARTGVTSLDEHLAKWTRRFNKPIILIANKSEGKEGLLAAQQAYKLGFGDPIALSAEHGEGFADFYQALVPYAKEEEFETESEKMPISLAIVGRPNVGKSTLLNCLLREERVLTGPEAGITRDAIAIGWSYKGRPFKLIDTAGMRRRSKVVDKVESLSTRDTWRAVQYAHVVVLLVDATSPFDKQDLTIARQVVDEGRALVIAVNKWDLVQDGEKYLVSLKKQLEDFLPQVKGVACLPLSAKEGKFMPSFLKAIEKAYALWNNRLSTSHLNKWLEEALANHPPPLIDGKRPKIRYMTQIKSRPPTFMLFVNKVMAFPESYLRYLTNSMRQAFNMPGVPMRLIQKAGENPYHKD